MKITETTVSRMITRVMDGDSPDKILETPTIDGGSIRRLGIHYGRSEWNHDTKKWHHVDRHRIFLGHDQISHHSRDEVHRQVIDQGERLIGKPPLPSHPDTDYYYDKHFK